MNTILPAKTKILVVSGGTHINSTEKCFPYFIASLTLVKTDGCPLYNCCKILGCPMGILVVPDNHYNDHCLY